jgi:hypothetical protein
MVTARPNGFIEPCILTRAAKPPAGPDWVHEIKHDGYRLIVRRDGDTVRLFTRRGYDWTDRYPAIARAAAKLRAKSFTLDGEAAVCGPDGVAVFDALHRRGTVTEAMLYAFDLSELDGTDMRAMPLGERKAKLARLLDRRRTGIVMNDHTDEDGATMGEDPVKEGLVASLNRPGGNITGYTNFANQLLGKRMGLLREIVPNATKLALLVNPNNPNAEPDMKDAQASAVALGRQLRRLTAKTERDFEVAFAAIVQDTAIWRSTHWS